MPDKGEMINYTYTASGAKIRQQLETDGRGGISTRRDYAGAFVFVNNAPGWFSTPHGRFVYVNDGWQNEFHLRDHLGNTRVVLLEEEGDEYKTLQQNHYYPFGMLIPSLSTTNTLGALKDNRYLYNGKLERSENPDPSGEFNDDFDLDWYDYGARFYDAQIARFHTLDPMAENYTFQSPFVYADNNPILFIDFMGMNSKRTNTPPLNNPWIRAALSPNVREKVQEGQKIGPSASITIGTQVSGAKVKGNILGLKFNLGATAGKIEHTTEFGSQGLTQTLSATALEGAAEFNVFGKFDASANAQVGAATMLLDGDKVSSSFSDISYSGEANTGPLNIDGEISGKVSAFGVTAGAMVNPVKLAIKVGNLLSTAQTFLNAVFKEATNPQNGIPEEYR
jgi:RHS repeat-associated protein